MTISSQYEQQYFAFFNVLTIIVTMIARKKMTLMGWWLIIYSIFSFSTQLMELYFPIFSIIFHRYFSNISLKHLSSCKDNNHFLARNPKSILMPHQPHCYGSMIQLFSILTETNFQNVFNNTLEIIYLSSRRF